MSNTYQPQRIFTIEEANAMLPLVRAITGDIVKLSIELLERRQRFAALANGRGPRDADFYSEEVAQVEREMEKDTEKLQEYLNELHSLGVEPKSGPEGLVDFPAMLDGRLVFLCWKHDEPEVLHWHDIDAGFAGRQPLTAGSCAHGDHSENGSEQFE
jgi:hypothetical protein